MNGRLDIRAAQHCATIAEGYYAHNNHPMPPSVAAYIAAIRTKTCFVCETCESTERPNSNHDIDVREAARLLGCSTQWVRRIASDLDGRRIAGRWVFNRNTVTEYAVAKHER